MVSFTAMLRTRSAVFFVPPNPPPPPIPCPRVWHASLAVCFSSHYFFSRMICTTVWNDALCVRRQPWSDTQHRWPKYDQKQTKKHSVVLYVWWTTEVIGSSSRYRVEKKKKNNRLRPGWFFCCCDFVVIINHCEQYAFYYDTKNQSNEMIEFN